MKLLFFGDSVTDMSRHRDVDFRPYSFGFGFPFFVEGALSTEYPGKYQIYNRGISGNRVVDLYARVKQDCWNLSPDVVTILIGVNDLWHELAVQNGVDLKRFEKVYDMLISDTKEALPGVKIILMQPFVLKGEATQNDWETFETVKDYGAAVKRLADKYNCPFVPLQKKFDELSKSTPASHWLFDGIHPAVAGAKVIADEWLRVFKENQ